MNDHESEEALICMPVELRPQGAPTPRWFRLALAISTEGVRLRSALPEELLERPIAVRLQLPLDTDPPPPPLHAVGRAAEVIVDAGEESERAEPRRVVFAGLGEAERALLRRYVQVRLDSPGPPG